MTASKLHSDWITAFSMPDANCCGTYIDPASLHTDFFFDIATDQICNGHKKAQSGWAFRSAAAVWNLTAT